MTDGGAESSSEGQDRQDTGRVDRPARARARVGACDLLEPGIRGTAGRFRRRRRHFPRELSKSPPASRPARRKIRSRWSRRSPKPRPVDEVGKVDREEAGRHRHRAAAAAEARGKAGREEARPAETGRRGQAEGRAEADEKKPDPPRSIRSRSHQEGRGRSRRRSRSGRKTDAAAAANRRRSAPSISRRSPPCSTSGSDAARGDRRSPEFQRALGASKRKAADNSATWGAMFKRRSFAAGTCPMTESTRNVRGRSRYLAQARWHARRHRRSFRTCAAPLPYLRSLSGERAARDRRMPAVHFLPAEHYDAWKFIPTTFRPKRHALEMSSIGRVSSLTERSMRKCRCA